MNRFFFVALAFASLTTACSEMELSAGTAPVVSPDPFYFAEPTVDFTGGVLAYGDIPAGHRVETTCARRDADGACAPSECVAERSVETENGRDDDCDGRIDNGLWAWADGVACSGDSDCASGGCSGVCVPTEF